MLLATLIFLVVFRQTQETPRQPTENPVTLTVKVTGINDGDSFRVELKSKTYRVRVAGIDCPEYKQAYSRKAHDFTSNLIYGKTVTLRVVDRDQYDRIVADVLLPDGRNLAEQLLSNGLAWWYRQIQPNNKTYERLEAEAKGAKRGLWVDKDPIPPWRFRRERDGSGGLKQRKAA
jgi:endonuclease YncB( thermonuclease family)